MTTILWKHGLTKAMRLTAQCFAQSVSVAQCSRQQSGRSFLTLTLAVCPPASFTYLYCSSLILCYFTFFTLWTHFFVYCYTILTNFLAIISSADYDYLPLMSLHLSPCLGCLWILPPWSLGMSSTAPKFLTMGLRAAAISSCAWCLVMSQLAWVNEQTNNWVS